MTSIVMQWTRLHPLKTAKGKYQGKKKLDSGNTVYIYGPRQISNRHKEKAERLEGLQKKIPELRKKLRKSLDNPVAVVISLIDETAERVGNPNSAEKGHFGVTGWRKKHLSFKDGKAILSYVGKSGVKQKKEVTSKPLVKALREVSKGLSPEEELFPEVQSKDVNKFLKEFDISAKDLRGFHANNTMHKLLKEKRKNGPDLPFKRKEKDEILKKEFLQALKETAKIVGHEESTLRSQYLVPGLEDDYLHNGEVSSSMKKASSPPLTLVRSGVWFSDVSKDSFIHFTLESRAEMILQSGRLLMRPPFRKFGIDAVNGISVSWGKLVPGVQMTHLKEVSKGESLVAILFTTRTVPEIGYIEEVIWKKDVVFSSAKKISLSKALLLLQNNHHDMVDDQDIVVYEKSKVGKLEDSEKEDRSSKGQVRKDPTKKPPRYDLRRRNSTPKEQPEESKEMKRDTDPDLSRRSRNLSAFRLASMYLISKKKEEHKPGDVWQTKYYTWRGMNQEGKSDTFSLKEQAEEFAKGGQDSEEDQEDGDLQSPEDFQDEIEKLNNQEEEEEETSEDTSEENDTIPEEEYIPPEEEDSSGDINEMKRVVSELLDSETALDKESHSNLKQALKGLDPDQKKALSKALSKNLKSLVSQDGTSKEMVEMAKKALEFEDFEDSTDPEELGRKLAEALFAKNVVSNPMLLGGKKFSEKGLSPKEVSQRSTLAYDHYSKMSPELRKAAASKLNDFLKDLPEDDPRSSEVNGILSGIALSAIVAGDDPVPGRPEPSKGTASLIRHLAQQGNISTLLKPVEDYFDPENQEVLKSSMMKMSDDELFDLVMKEDEKMEGEHPYASLKKLFDQEIPIPYPYDAGIRDWIINDYLSDHTWKDTAIRDALKGTDHSADAEERFRMLGEIKRDIQNDLFDQWQKCMEDAQKAIAEGGSPSRSTEDCIKDFEESKRRVLEAETAESFLQALEEKGLELPNSPAIAILKATAAGNTEVLDHLVRPNPDSFSGKIARLSFDKHSYLHEPSFKRRRQYMTSKTAKAEARNIVASCDTLAEFFQKRASEAGIPPHVGLDMAKRLDHMSVYLEDRFKLASNPTDVVDPTENTTESDLQNWEFDPSTIGQQYPGPLMRDEDEPYMDCFKQDEYRQLREVQQGGMFSNAKAASAALAKLAALVTAHGIAIPVESSAKKKDSGRKS